MTTNKKGREQEEEWQAERDMKKTKEVDTVVLSLIAAFIFLILGALGLSDFFYILLGVALIVAVFTGR
ncbi:MAG: hypothetical protein K9J28_07045 [Sulfuritalea sp.]|nr:hypothetical protein [Sulfuritalea sp.]